jgi:Stage II sporulation protein E (SpoIIE)/Phosphoserine phosphatase RsbU, N-terminal domain
VDGLGSGLVGAYEAGLQRYVDSGDEVELEAAYAFSREAFGAEMTILDVVDVHRRAVERLVGRASSADVELIAASFSFLSQALSTFEMTQRGYWEAQQHAEREHAIALSLQHDLLPRAVPEVAGLDLSVRYFPGEAGSHAGGDWYDIFELDANRVGLVVGDVTGHGVRAAAAMGRLRVAVLAHALGGLVPADVVKRVDTLLDQLGTGEIATMVYVVADPGRGRLVVANAGHPPPVVVEPDGASRRVEIGHGRLLGLHPALPRRDQDAMQIRSGGHLLLYTDGLIEPLERAGHDGVAQLCRVVEGFRGTAQQLCGRVLGELAPEGARDDICVVAATLIAQPRPRRLGRRAPRRSIVRAVETGWLSRLGRR